MSEQSQRNGKKKTIVVKGKDALVAAITSDPATARWLMDHAETATPTKGSVLVTNKATGFGTSVDVQTAAYFLGLSVNGGQPGGKPFGWDPSTHVLYFAYGEDRVRICDTRVPAGSKMEVFLRAAAEIAGVPEEDLARMFPKREPSILVLNPVPEPVGIVEQPA